WHIGLVASRWYKDNKVGFNFENTLQNPIITFCKDPVLENNSGSISAFDFAHIRQICGGDLYTSILQEITSNRIKYGCAYGMIRKVIDIAILTNLYEKLIGMFQNFLSTKQQTLNNENNNTDSTNYVQVHNPVVSVRKGRLPGRAKSNVEIQDKQVRRYNPLTPNNINNQESEDNMNINQKTCQNCGKKGHNCATCKAKHL
ncbi:19124_t:CDS:1, partial [Racocetra fulgida]